MPACARREGVCVVGFRPDTVRELKHHHQVVMSSGRPECRFDPGLTEPHGLWPHGFPKGTRSSRGLHVEQSQRNHDLHPGRHLVAGWPRTSRPWACVTG